MSATMTPAEIRFADALANRYSNRQEEMARAAMIRAEEVADSVEALKDQMQVVESLIKERIAALESERTHENFDAAVSGAELSEVFERLNALEARADDPDQVATKPEQPSLDPLLLAIRNLYVLLDEKNPMGNALRSSLRVHWKASTGKYSHEDIDAVIREYGRG